MIHKYRKKPVIVEAVQYTGLNDQEISDFCGASIGIGDGPHLLPIIKTPESEMTVCVSDYIIKEPGRDPYPCKPTVFRQTYELVKESQSAESKKVDWNKIGRMADQMVEMLNEMEEEIREESCDGNAGKAIHSDQS